MVELKTQFRNCTTFIVSDISKNHPQHFDMCDYHPATISKISCLKKTFLREHLTGSLDHQIKFAAIMITKTGFNVFSPPPMSIQLSRLLQ